MRIIPDIFPEKSISNELSLPNHSRAFYLKNFNKLMNGLRNQLIAFSFFVIVVKILDLYFIIQKANREIQFDQFQFVVAATILILVIMFTLYDIFAGQLYVGYEDANNWQYIHEYVI